MSEYILSVENLMMHFGGIKALSDVSLKVKRNSIFALIGPNGAGKTTVFNCLTGFYKASGGRIELNTRGRQTNVIKLLGEPFRATDFVSPKSFASRLYYKMFGGTHLVNRAGLARTFQNIRLFKEMSVVENLLVAQHMWVNRNLLAGILNTKGYRKAESAALDQPSTGWRWWTWWTAPTAWPASCPTASNGAWRSPGPCVPGRRSSASTSRPPASTPRKPRR